MFHPVFRIATRSLSEVAIHSESPVHSTFNRSNNPKLEQARQRMLEEIALVKEYEIIDSTKMAAALKESESTNDNYGQP